MVGAFDIPDSPELSPPSSLETLPDPGIPDVPEIIMPEIPGMPEIPETPDVPPMPGDNPSDSAVPTFEGLLKEGTITQHGSWFEYEGKKYRKAELEDILNG